MQVDHLAELGNDARSTNASRHVDPQGLATGFVNHIQRSEHLAVVQRVTHEIECSDRQIAFIRVRPRGVGARGAGRAVWSGAEGSAANGSKRAIFARDSSKALRSQPKTLAPSAKREAIRIMTEEIVRGNGAAPVAS
jgi:hypothetical protein